jgi:hypothetical protein
MIRFRGTPRLVNAVSIKGKTFVITKGLINTASLKHEWRDDVDDPEEISLTLKGLRPRVDMLKFWQRIPESDAKFVFYKEWRDIAAIPITNYKHWFEKQISPKARNKIRKAQKAGVVVKQVELDDDLVRGIMGVFNESPVRRGKPFWHYGKSFETVKQEMSIDLNHSVFVGAYFGGNLIGFIKFLVEDRYARVTLILDRTSQRDKAPMNGMIAKVIEICAERGIPHFLYTIWRRGEHGSFQESNGFIKIPVPQYFVPLTLRGELALRLNLHKGVKGALPDAAMTSLLELRTKWYSKHGRQAGAALP